MLSQWVWIMVCNSEPVVVNHGLLCGASGCESWCVLLSQWLLIMMYIQHCTLWLTPTGSAKHTMTQNHWLSTTHHDLQSIAQDYTPWFTINCSGLHTMIQNHLLRITHVSFAGPVGVSHGVQWWASGCELWCVMLSQWLLIMDCYDVLIFTETKTDEFDELKLPEEYTYFAKHRKKN
jgi:hypothetical protein